MSARPNAASRPATDTAWLVVDGGVRLIGRRRNERPWRRIWSQLGGCGMMTQAATLPARDSVEVAEVVSSGRSSNGRGTGDGDLRSADRRPLARGGLLPRSGKV